MKETITQQLIAVQQASREIITLTDEAINSLLLTLADSIPAHRESILEANQKDIERMDPADPMVDRLLLNASRLDAIAADIRNVASLPSPLDSLLEARVLPNGLNLKKVTVPIGVIGIIYEARPNVTFDVFALCLKSGNAVILRGGSETIHSNTALVQVVRDAAVKAGGGTVYTGMLQAYAAFSLLQTAPKKVGFASGCQAFGHRELLGQLRSFGLVMNPILTVHS